ncbi:hypothetical protein ACIQRW_30635 [Streptomyces sp. NPDC091287]|uniref:hypothetical protein n=1 Tax=Streptomyces sp. NPDC091287 TaxID=3365988 RepID=UPI0038214F8C
MRSRIIAIMAAVAAATAALAQPAHAAPVVDGVYRFAALQDGKCLVWPKSHASIGSVGLGACTESASTSANWQVHKRPNGTMEVSTPGSNPRTCLGVNTNYRVRVSDSCTDKYAEWTVSFGSAGPGRPGGALKARLLDRGQRVVHDDDRLEESAAAQLPHCDGLPLHRFRDGQVYPVWPCGPEVRAIPSRRHRALHQYDGRSRLQARIDD